MSWTADLHATLDRRATAEQVARIIADGAPRDWPRNVLLEARRVASSRPDWYITSMPEDFERPDDCRRKLAAAGRLFGTDVSGVDPADGEAIRGLIERLGAPVGWRPGMDWKADRRCGGERRLMASLDVPEHDPALVSKRQYNRHVRILRYLWAKAERMMAAQHQRELVLTGRSGFASRITADRFAGDPVTASFIAYYTARKNRRRLFTLAGKENPVDHLAQSLLDLAMRSDPDWGMLAWAYPQPQALAHLTSRELGALLGDWHAVMRGTAVELERAWPGDANVNRMTMIVRRGMDSSTWNTMAQAYNAARAGWLSCLAASGALALLEPSCPGKVMRLMAADLAYWHQSSGGDVDPNTKVWARLPLPWQVLDGSAVCTAADVRAACAEAGLAGPGCGGWLAPLDLRAPAQFSPTPDLVHGIAVSDPAWAALLRRAGAFSGKRIKEGYEDDLAQVPREVITGPRPVYHPVTGKYLGSSGQQQLP